MKTGDTIKVGIDPALYNDALEWAGVTKVKIVKKDDGGLSVELDATDPDTISQLINGILFGFVNSKVLEKHHG